jgi:branched-chain amino acid transport system permease protein
VAPTALGEQMTFFLQYLVFGVALGCVYALVALGFTIIYKASGVINFAQGELLLVGAFTVSAGVFVYRLSFPLALFIGLAFTVLIGVLFERFVLRRMIGRPVFAILMITIGLDVLLLTAVSARFGSDARPAAMPVTSEAGFVIGDVRILTNEIITIVVTLACCVALFLFFRFTKYGLAMRATALDQEAAMALGISIRTVYALAWGIAAAVATIGGVLLPPALAQSTIDLSMGQVALRAFPAIILGGLDSISGAVVGGLIIGLTEQFIAGYEAPFEKFVGRSFYEVAPYLLMIVILLIRPYGLFGRRKVERV